MTNPITREIRATRHRLAAKFDNDLDRIVDDLQRQQCESGLEYVDLTADMPNRTLPASVDHEFPGSGESTPAAR
jgi:hypothetical protein